MIAAAAEAAAAKAKASKAASQQEAVSALHQVPFTSARSTACFVSLAESVASSLLFFCMLSNFCTAVAALLHHLCHPSESCK
jgi:hypothetical protein